jgi:hypothetical protein
VGAVVVAVAAVGIEAVRQLFSELGELIRPVLGAQPGKIGFGMGAGPGVDSPGQLVVEAADDCDMPGPEPPGALRGRGGRQYRRQGFTGERAALAQISGVAHTAGGFGAAGQRPVGDRVGELAPEFFGSGLLLELIDERMFAGGQASSHLLVALQHYQPLSGAQHFGIEPDNSVECGIQPIKGRRECFAIRNDT